MIVGNIFKTTVPSTYSIGLTILYYHYKYNFQVGQPVRTKLLHFVVAFKMGNQTIMVSCRIRNELLSFTVSSLKSVSWPYLRFVYNVCHFSCLQSSLSIYHQNVKTMATSKSDDFAISSKLQDKGNGLLLYLNNYSFYAQKVSTGSPSLLLYSHCFTVILQVIM